MIVYPQFGTGSMAQFPIRKKQLQRTVVNAALDGSSIRLADSTGASTQWVLRYIALTDAEREILETFFETTEGSLNTFTFLDPTANLLAWSDQLSNSAWQTGPQLTLAAGMADPVGGLLAWKLSNLAAATQGISQTIQAPASYQYCFSSYMRADQSTTVTMTAGGQQAMYRATPSWARVTFPIGGGAAANSINFGIELPAGATVYVYGVQTEAQAGASPYKSSMGGGVYSNARLAHDLLTFTATAPRQHACTVTIINVNHL